MIRLGLALDKQSFLHELGEIKILVSHPGNARLSSSSEKGGVRVGEPLAWQVIYFTYHIPPFQPRAPWPPLELLGALSHFRPRSAEPSP